MLTDLETFLIEITKLSIENRDFDRDKTQRIFKRYEIDQLQTLIFTILESKHLQKGFLIFKIIFLLILRLISINTPASFRTFAFFTFGYFCIF